MEDIKDFFITVLIIVAFYATGYAMSYAAQTLMFASLNRKAKDGNWKKAAKAFGVRVNKLKKMKKDEIKALYRKLVMKHHPDKGGDPDKFRNIHEAYEFAYAA